MFLLWEENLRDMRAAFMHWKTILHNPIYCVICTFNINFNNNLYHLIVWIVLFLCV